MGLLLLRMATAAMFALNITHRFNFASPVVYWAVVSAIALISFSLCLGFLTPILAAIACVTAVANFFVLADQPGVVVYILRILTSGALFFLGPGAYSVDARLFGLRVTVVPPRKAKNGGQLFI